MEAGKLSNMGMKEMRERSRGAMQDGKAKPSKIHQSLLRDSRKALRVQERSAAGRKSLRLQAFVQPGPQIKSEPQQLFYLIFPRRSTLVVQLHLRSRVFEGRRSEERRVR